MIHIDYPGGKKPKRDWIKQAEALTELLKAAPDKDARDRIIEKNSSLWGEVKGWLGKFSNGKCWFTEAKNPSCHLQVDHFRPKKAANGPDRDGYWWLAFDFRNFRLCGNIVNPKKGSHFPLKVGTVAALTPTDNHEDEACVLIDPIRVDDVDLLTFCELGKAVPSETTGWGRERAERSIDLYNLNGHWPLRKARAQVWNTCKHLLDRIEYLIKLREEAEADGKTSPGWNVQIESLKRNLKSMVSPSAEFSAVARACLLQDRRMWARKCVLLSSQWRRLDTGTTPSAD